METKNNTPLSTKVVIIYLAALIFLNPFAATKQSPLAAGSVVAAWQLFQANKMVPAGILLYASIFSIALLVYALYGWKKLAIASQKTDKIWAWVLGIIFLLNISGAITIIFTKRLTWDTLISSAVFILLILGWHYFETRGKTTQKITEKSKEVKEEKELEQEEEKEEVSEAPQETLKAKKPKKKSKKKK